MIDQLTNIVDVVLTVLLILGAVLVIVRFIAYRRRQRHLHPDRLLANLKWQLVHEIATTLGKPLIEALAVSDDALLAQARRFTPEQRAAVTLWLLDTPAPVKPAQRDRIIMALRRANSIDPTERGG